MSSASAVRARYSRPSYKVLVLDQDDRVATTVAHLLSPGAFGIIACRDMAAAEAALDSTEFDLILAAPSCTGVGGREGLEVASFLARRNPTARMALIVPREDTELQAAAAHSGWFATLRTPASTDELSTLLSDLGFPCLP